MISRIFFALVFCCAGTGGTLAQQLPAQIIQDVTVVDVRQGVLLPSRSVTIAGNEIRAITQGQGELPAEATIIDGSGAFLIPGLLDMHTHLRGNGMPAWLTTDWMMPLILAHGVTGVRDMNSDCDGPSQGPVCIEQMRQWQARIEDGTLLGPRLLALSSFLVNPPWDYEMSEEQARGFVRAMAEQGVPNLKIYDRLSPTALGWMADEAASLGMGVWGHVPLRMTAAQASRLGMRSIEHARDFLFDCFPGRDDFRGSAVSSSAAPALLRRMVDEYDPAVCRAEFDVLVQNNTWYVPTHVTRRRDALAADTAARNDPRIDYLFPALYQDWLRNLDRIVEADAAAQGATYRDFYRKGLEITGAAHRAGVRILVGTDAPDPLVYPGSSIHDELAELVNAGLTPAEALKAATFNGAEFLGITAKYGSIEPGKRADLVLLDANPLEEISNTRNIRAVIFNGLYLDRSALDALLDQVKETAQRPLIPAGGTPTN